MISNAPKHYTMHQNMSLGSNGADWVRSLWKIPTWLHGTNFYFNCTSSLCFALSFMQLWNDPKCTQTLCNAPKHEFRVQWGGLGALVAIKSDTTLWHKLFSLIAPLQPKLLRVLYSNKMIPNAPKHYETHQNLSLGSNRVDQVCLLQKCPMRLRWPSFYINCTNLAYFAPSFVQ